MQYKLELICHHPPHQCRCRHNVATEVDQQDLTANLIKHNPALLKYLGRPTRTVEIDTQTHNSHKQQEDNQQRRVATEENQPYRSIVQEKGLRFIIDDQYGTHQTNIPNQQQPKETPKVKSPRNVVFEQQQPAETIPPYHPNASSKQKPKPMTSQEKDTKKYHKNLVNQSRYLSDTAFRKYFDRQCFENYGRNNTSHKADGFVYGNYLKTYNINPHSGQNMPLNEETFYHALVSASPEKYALYTQEVKLSNTMQKSSQKSKQKDLNNSLQKDKLNVQKMLQDNLKHSKLQKKYDHLKLKTTKTHPSKPHSAKPKPGLQSRDTKVPSHLEINTKKNFKPESINSASPRHNHHPSESKTESINPVRTSILNTKSQYVPQPQEKPQTASKDTLLLTNPNPTPTSPKSQITCSHADHQQSPSCACCLNQMKRMIIQLASRDADLADRIISSAQKTTLYKNYSLNNFQNAPLNPKNYRQLDGRLNVYEG